ncbi:MAG: Rsd/AlgQ family anti-sigma factor [Succinivibrio sp.]|nr:Rsd/AlgQ family anti-sigma factor [Succinivibrio sp.]
MDRQFLRGFNIELQQVDERYGWINDMIKARQELVVLYMKLLAEAAPSETGASPVSPSYEDIHSFCEHMIDYLSHGHFDLYPKILELIENASGRSLSIAHRVLPKIEATTEYLMRFNDRYGEDLNEGLLKTLAKDLENVGKCIEQRFRNEDRLIIGLRIVHTIIEHNA